jgi:hypothetical protein
VSTSRKHGSKFLGVITREKAEKLLLDWANLRISKDEGPLRRLVVRYPEVFIPLSLDQTFADAPRQAWELERLLGHLRKAWDAPDRRHRDWYIFHLRAKYSEWTRGMSLVKPEEEIAIKPIEWYEEPPPITPLEATMIYFQTTIADRAKHCGGPDCPAPYFIAIKKWQKYCSEKCAGPAARESKRQWWRENRAKNGGIE